jgi:F-type H+-transporting ATPase subunit c
MNDLTFLGLGYIGAGVGAGLTLIGAGLGIGKLAAAALDGTARQPEAGPALRTTMIIAAALIEGLGFLALVICFFAVMNLAMPKESAAPAAGASQSQPQH